MNTKYSWTPAENGKRPFISERAFFQQENGISIPALTS
jgi:hypothetical protein